MSTLTDVAPVDLSDFRSYVHGVPHAWFAYLRRQDPVHWHDEATGPGFWVVTQLPTTASRSTATTSASARPTRADLPMGDARGRARAAAADDAQHGPAAAHPLPAPGQQGLHAPHGAPSSRRSIHGATDAIIDDVIEVGQADFVTDISAELPLQVIADLLGVPADDRHKMFEWSNRMVGNEDAEYQEMTDAAAIAAMDLYAYAAELYGKKRIDPHADLMSVLTTVEVEGERSERAGARALLPHVDGRRE